MKQQPFSIYCEKFRLKGQRVAIGNGGHVRGAGFLIIFEAVPLWEGKQHFCNEPAQNVLFAPRFESVGTSGGNKLRSKK